MARNVQIGNLHGPVRRWTFLVRKVVCCLSIGALLCGCSGRAAELELPYSFDGRRFPVEIEEIEREHEALFASDLCVVSDEAVFAPEDTTSEAAALFDISGQQVLYSKNAFEQLYPASITKVMYSY